MSNTQTQRLNNNAVGLVTIKIHGTLVPFCLVPVVQQPDRDVITVYVVK